MLRTPFIETLSDRSSGRQSGVGKTNCSSRMRIASTAWTRSIRRSYWLGALPIVAPAPARWSPISKVPKAFHWVDAMPTGPTGKLFRRALRMEG